MSELLRFEVFGKPEPQGSATAFVPLRNGYPIARGGRLSDGRYRNGSVVANVTSANPRLRQWRELVASVARQHWTGGVLEDVALEVESHFFLRRPEGHWRSGRFAHLLRDDAPAVPLTVPDADKLLRAVLDALTGIVYVDDRQVTFPTAEKHYAIPREHTNGEGCRVIVRRCAVQVARDLPAAERERWLPSEHQEADPAQMALAQIR